MFAIPPEVFDPTRLKALDGYGILDTPGEEGFDDIVHIASHICRTPVALVSLVGADRQWFKARVGFPPCETDLDRSVCAFVLAEPDLLIIPDLSEDPRTQHNPLVTGDPFIRFYAGAPLRAPGGEVLGSLCVIDPKPRPEGLSDAQKVTLRALARQVMGQLELRRAIKGRDALLLEQEATLREIDALTQAQSAVAAAGGDLDKILNSVLAGAMRAIPDADAGTVDLIVGAEMEYRAVIGTATPFLGQRVPIKGSLAGTCAFTNTPLLVPDVLADPRVNRDLAVRVSLRSALFAPVSRGDQVLGVLKIHAGTAGVFSERDLLQARLFAGVASAGLTEAREAEAQRALAASEIHWNGLFEQLQEGFILGEVIRDATGRIADWRYIEVNQAWGELVGVPSVTAVGRTIREVFPGIEDEWVNEFADVTDTGESITFTRQVGALDRWYEGRANRISSERFAVVFLEVTARVLADRALRDSERTKAALLELGDRLRATGKADEMAFAAADIMGRALDATRAGYGAINIAAETIDIAADWQGPGITSIAGVHRFRDFGSFIDDLRRGELVVIDDVTSDPRTNGNAEAFTAIGIRSLVNVPLIEHGVLVAMLFVQHDQPHAWTQGDFAFVRDVADRTRAAIARVRAEEQQQLVNHELSHRMKNLLAMVQSIATQTMRNAADVSEAKDILSGRLIALGRAHDLLMGGALTSTGLEPVLRSALSIHTDKADRFTLSGPAIDIGPDQALSLALMLHELATNASKYGALSTDAGRVDIRWEISQDDAPQLRLTWEEQGGPRVTPPARKGFGTRFIERGLAAQVNGVLALEYPPSGVTCAITAPLSAFQGLR